MLNYIYITFIVASCFIHGSCTVIESRFEEDTPGIVYYLPKTMLKVEIDNSKNPPTFDATAYNIPDPSQKYTLYYRPNALFTDRVCAAVDPANPSLLQSVEFSSQDSTPEVVIALSELVAKTANAQREFIATRAVARKALPLPGNKVAYTVDLSEPGALRSLNQKLGRAHPGFAVQIPGFEDYLEGDGRSRCEDKGVCFRTAVKAPVQLLYNGAQVAEASSQATIINHRHIGSMDLDRAFLVEKVVRLGFKDGTLTHVVIRKPSEALQTVKLPLSVVDTILAVPANFANKITAGGADSSANQLAAINTKLDALAQRYQPDALGDADYKAVFKLSCAGTLSSNAPKT